MRRKPNRCARDWYHPASVRFISDAAIQSTFSCIYIVSNLSKPPCREAALMPWNEEELKQRARVRIREGMLPCVTHYRTWGGHGSNEPCALCDLVIGGDEVEYEI